MCNNCSALTDELKLLIHCVSWCRLKLKLREDNSDASESSYVFWVRPCVRVIVMESFFIASDRNHVNRPMNGVRQLKAEKLFAVFSRIWIDVLATSQRHKADPVTLADPVNRLIEFWCYQNGRLLGLAGKFMKKVDNSIHWMLAKLELFTLIKT